MEGDGRTRPERRRREEKEEEGREEERVQRALTQETLEM